MITNSDQNKAKIPHNRQEVFFDLFKHYKLMMLQINLGGLLFALPAILLLYFSNLTKGALAGYIAEGIILPPYPEDINLSISIMKMQINNLTFLIFIPLMMLASLGLAGVFHLVQKMIFADNVLFSSDFKAGIKKNGRDYALLSLIFGISLFFLVFVTGYYQHEPNLIIKSISFGIAIMQFVLVLGTLSIALPFKNLYKSSLLHSLVQSFTLFAKNIGHSTLILIISLFPMILLIIPSIWIKTGVGVLLLAFVFAYVAVIWVLGGNALFDKYINPGQYNQIIRKGMAND